MWWIFLQSFLQGVVELATKMNVFMFYPLAPGHMFAYTKKLTCIQPKPFTLHLTIDILHLLSATRTPQLFKLVKFLCCLHTAYVHEHTAFTVTFPGLYSLVIVLMNPLAVAATSSWLATLVLFILIYILSIFSHMLCNLC
jgi:hypothetical protein